MEAQRPDGPGPADRSWQRNLCFACGPENATGLRLQFVLGPEGHSYLCEFELGSEFGGPPGHAHGGIIATILDEAMGKANKLRGRIALTRRMQIDYLRPVPLGRRLIVEGWARSARGRVLYNHAELRSPEGVVLARSRGKFIAIDAEKMFARELEDERRAQR
jgi:acyl-coenzyme A thioesterase PaaI-like protein